MPVFEGRPTVRRSAEERRSVKYMRDSMPFEAYIFPYTTQSQIYSRAFDVIFGASEPKSSQRKGKKKKRKTFLLKNASFKIVFTFPRARFARWKARGNCRDTSVGRWTLIEKRCLADETLMPRRVKRRNVPSCCYSPMYLPANWLRIVPFVRWIQEIAVVHRRRRRSPRRPRAALRLADQHFRPAILEGAASATLADPAALHRLLRGQNQLFHVSGFSRETWRKR